ncbi:MAG: tRNA (guanosine(37)-N1)-methyltransferase TrmD [Deltaproteobacteria bacterium]|nr:tRNA (guanosine(37)-N1)-methyltransferase TrmD [Deltaproteobacteria bacterium]
MMIIDILTIFPELVRAPLQQSILGKAIERGLIDVRIVNIRDFAVDRHLTTDDRPYGGGSGMVMKIEPLVGAIRRVRSMDPPVYVVLMSPQGRLFKQEIAWELSRLQHISLVCGRYEGIDERLRSYVDDEISIGDYIVSGGELPALVVTEAVSRLIPGVLGNREATAEETFADTLLEYPQYTRPEVFEGQRVPEVLLSGNHEAIRRWRRQQSLYRTWKRRRDLLARAILSTEDRQLLAEIIEGEKEQQGSGGSI